MTNSHERPDEGCNIFLPEPAFVPATSTPNSKPANLSRWVCDETRMKRLFLGNLLDGAPWVS